MAASANGSGGDVGLVLGGGGARGAYATYKRIAGARERTRFMPGFFRSG
jgi:hypothetical protein